MSIESVVFMVSGDGVIIFDDVEILMGGLFVINCFKIMRDGMMYSDSFDYMIVGSDIGLIVFKGLDIVLEVGVVFVVDVNEVIFVVCVFLFCVLGNVVFLLIFEVVNGVCFWDVDYDLLIDSVYLVLINGLVVVFEEVMCKMESGEIVIMGEDRLIVFVSGGIEFVVLINIYGIDYDS